MKKEMEKIDELIKEALNKEEAAFYDELGEQGLLGKVRTVHKGKMGWLATVMNIFHILVFGVFLYCVVQFLKVEETNLLIKWAAAGFVCLVFMTGIKMYMWMQMDKNTILRELKRLELQLSSLVSKREY